MIDFGIGDPREPTDPLHPRRRSRGARASGSAYPLAHGPARAARGDRRLARAPLRRRGRPGRGDRADARLEGGDLLVRPGRVDPAGEKRLVAFTEPGYPVYERGALFAGAEVVDAAAARGERLPARPRRGSTSWERIAILWVNYPNNPTGAVAPLAFYERARGARARARLRRSPPTRRTRSSGSTSRRSRRCRSRDRANVVVFNTLSQALVDDGLPLGLRRGAAGVVAALAAFRPTVGTAPQEFVQRASVAAWADESTSSDARAIYRAQARDAPAARSSARACALAGSDGDVLPVGRGRTATSEAFARRLLERGVSSRRASFFGPPARATCASRSSRRRRSASAPRRSCGRCL